LLVFSFALISTPARAGIIEFYPVASARTNTGVDPAKLKSVGDLEIDGTHVAFWGYDKRQPILFSLTPFKVKDPEKQLAMGDKLSGKETSQDWGYLFDRNADGKVDYVCYLMGPMPVKGSDFRSDFPKRVPGENTMYEGADLQYMFEHLRGIFYHAGDDDFDGKADGFVLCSMDPDRDWVDGYGLFRSTKAGAGIDEARRFTDDITKPTGVPKRVEGGWAWLALNGKSRTIGPEMLDRWSSLLAQLNTAAVAFKLKPGSLPQE
jgi:hypothetical protein